MLGKTYGHISWGAAAAAVVAAVIVTCTYSYI